MKAQGSGMPRAPPPTKPTWSAKIEKTVSLTGKPAVSFADIVRAEVRSCPVTPVRSGDQSQRRAETPPTLAQQWQNAHSPEVLPKPQLELAPELLPQPRPLVGVRRPVLNWLQQFMLDAYAPRLCEEGYDDLIHLCYLTEEEINEVMQDVGMKKGHARTFLREWIKLRDNCKSTSEVTTSESAPDAPADSADADRDAAAEREADTTACPLSPERHDNEEPAVWPSLPAHGGDGARPIKKKALRMQNRPFERKDACKYEHAGEQRLTELLGSAEFAEGRVSSDVPASVNASMPSVVLPDHCFLCTGRACSRGHR